jgi:hypothetical protein
MADALIIFHARYGDSDLAFSNPEDESEPAYYKARLLRGRTPTLS